MNCRDRDPDVPSEAKWSSDPGVPPDEPKEKCRRAVTVRVRTKDGPTAKDRIGKVYRKAVYREYTDASFTILKKRPPEWEHLGLLGPVLRAEVGDTIRVVFRNNGTQAYSMHPHGVFYEKSSEGAHYNDGANDSTLNGTVSPGETHTYIWEVPGRAGPGPNNPSSMLWLYHSHNYEPKDTEAGLIGAIVVTRRGMARPDGSPKDVDREFVTAFFAVNENSSWLPTTDPCVGKAAEARFRAGKCPERISSRQIAKIVTVRTLRSHGFVGCYA